MKASEVEILCSEASRIKRPLRMCIHLSTMKSKLN